LNEQASELVSIIIPVYNSENYLERCVSSALKQTHRALQIILVNDGSTDRSGDMCDAFAAAHPLVEVFHMENRGLSAARNMGLDNARGQWVTFLDADDYFSPRFVELNLAACFQYSADIAASRFIIDTAGTLGEDSFILASQYECITGREAVIRHFGKGAGLLNTAPGKLGRASLWKDLRFPEGKIIEDVFVSHHLLHRAKRVVVSDARLYAYYQSPDSIMRSAFTLKRLDSLDSWQEGVRFFEELGDRELADIALRVYCNRLFDAFCLCKKFLPHEREVLRQLRLRAIDAFMEVRRVRSYIDQPLTVMLLYRGKQIVGRYFPAVYSAMFLRGRTYV